MSRTKRTSHCLTILLTLSVCFVTLSCTTSAAGECPRFSKIASDEFEDYMREHGQTPMVQAVLRRAQFCKAIREHSQ